MANLLAAGAAYLAAQLKASAAVTVTYSDGVNSVEISATPGNTPYDVMDRNGVLTQKEARDFIVTAADLVLNSQTVLPQSGHTITETVGSATHTYVVLRIPGANEYRYVDQTRQLLRIHTELRSKA